MGFGVDKNRANGQMMARRQRRKLRARIYLMAKPDHSSDDGFVRPGFLYAIQFLTLAAFGVSCYLLWVSLSGGVIAGCGPDSSCDRVLHSRWSRWLGLPVSALALAVYATILGASFGLRKTAAPARQRNAWVGLIPCAAVVAGAAIWFIILQAFILKSFCPYCMVAHGCGLAAATVLLFCAPIRNPPEKPKQHEKQVFIPRLLGGKLVLVALAGVALLVAGQFVRSPGREYVVKMFDGNVQMDLRQVPLMGKPDAPYSIVSLYDYTCHHCRIMHWHLMEARQKFSNELAIVSLPMPLSEKCNHTVKHAPKAQAQACDYARIGLAVWRANRKALSQFDDWMFTPASPPPLAEARQHASQLAGFIGFEAAMKDPWLDAQIQRDVSIYETNYLRGIGNMPQLIVGTNLSSGNFARVDDLYRLLSDKLGLKAPAH